MPSMGKFDVLAARDGDWLSKFRRERRVLARIRRAARRLEQTEKGFNSMR